MTEAKCSGAKKKVHDFNKEIENCCRENLISLLKYFIQFRKANLKTKNDFLILASKHGNKKIVEYLIENGIDINQQSKSKHKEGEGGDEKEKRV